MKLLYGVCILFICMLIFHYDHMRLDDSYTYLHVPIYDPFTEFKVSIDVCFLSILSLWLNTPCYIVTWWIKGLGSCSNNKWIICLAFSPYIYVSSKLVNAVAIGWLSLLCYAYIFITISKCWFCWISREGIEFIMFYEMR